MKKEIDYKKIFKLILIVYFAISPIFDTIFLYSHMTTLIRVALLIFFAFVTVFLYKDSRRSALYLLAYYLAIGLYLVIDYIHAGAFHSLVPGNLNYSIVSEASTLLKLCMPFTILFIVKYQKFDKSDFFHIVNSWIIIVAGSIVVCNLVGYSMGSYSDTIVRNSIFTWGQNLPVEVTATKGFFVYANQATVIILLSLVLAIYEFLFIKKRNILYIILIALSSLMLGTRLSTYGGLLVLIGMSIGYFIYYLIFKRKFCKNVIWLLPVAILWIIIIPYSPNQNRVDVMNSIDKAELVDDNSSEANSVVDDRPETVRALDETHLLGRQFYTEFYPYECDPEFWDEIKENHITEISNYRFIEKSIIKRIWEVDGRWSNNLVGISNARIQNVVNIESDIVLHYYAFGIIGTILVLIYYLYILVVCARDIFKNWSSMDVTIFACAVLYLMCAVFSGNAINFLATIVPIAFITGHTGAFKD